MKKTKDFYRYGIANNFNRAVYIGCDSLREARRVAEKERAAGNSCFIVRLNEFNGDILRTCKG